MPARLLRLRAWQLILLALPGGPDHEQHGRHGLRGRPGVQQCRQGVWPVPDVRGRRQVCGRRGGPLQQPDPVRQQVRGGRVQVSVQGMLLQLPVW